jgi:SAM-dependent methyltransferase
MAATGESDWFENDEFWELTAEFMFSAERRLAAPVEVEQMLALTGLDPAGATVLDMPCGVGRHTLEFARRGARVTAVDRTERYLDEVREAAEAGGLDVETVQSDMREFERADSYDLAIRIFTTGYFDDPEDDRRVTMNYYRSFRPGGALIMELSGKEGLIQHFRSRWWSDVEGGFLLEESTPTPDWSALDTRWILIRDGERHEFDMSARIYAASELGSLLRSCGFRDLETYGGLDGSPYDLSGTRLCIVARK